MRAAAIGSAVLILFLSNTSEAQTCSDVLVPSTGHLASWGIFRDSDPTMTRKVSYEGRGERTVYDGRVDRLVTFNAYFFKVQYGALPEIEFTVNPEAGSLEAARAAVDVFAPKVGRLPAVLLSGITIVIHIGEHRVAYGPPGYIVAYLEERDGIRVEGAEVTLMHEATHALLDAEHARAPAWVDAQNADGAFITTYACQYPAREDLAETMVGWFAVKYRPERLTAEQYRWIVEKIPNRIAYLDSQRFDMSPYFPANADTGFTFGRRNRARGAVLSRGCGATPPGGLGVAP